jgi:hypothetical protein
MGVDRGSLWIRLGGPYKFMEGAVALLRGAFPVEFRDGGKGFGCVESDERKKESVQRFRLVLNLDGLVAEDAWPGFLQSAIEAGWAPEMVKAFRRLIY